MSEKRAKKTKKGQSERIQFTSGLDHALSRVWGDLGALGLLWSERTVFKGGGDGFWVEGTRRGVFLDVCTSGIVAGALFRH